MDRLIGNKVIDSEFNEINSKECMKNKKMIGLYFSGSYCPSSIKFTPILNEVYLKIKERNPNFEIVFISSDKTIESFNHYLKYMPWVAVPYDQKNIKTKLCNMFEIKTLPQLVLINEQGDIINTEGRYYIYNNRNNISHIIEDLKL
jgi:nucleoredoxin